MVNQAQVRSMPTWVLQHNAQIYNKKTCAEMDLVCSITHTLC